jgi:multidrug efflux pump subunit AcrA (membrane-fusion protein)
MRSNPSKALLAAVLFAWVAVNARGQDRKDNPAPPAVKFAGRVEAEAVVGLSARVAGVVDKVDVNEGDRVKKGQVLIELSAPELNDDLDAAGAKLEQAKAEVQQAEAATQAAKARTAQAETTLHAAEDVLKRAVSNATAVPEFVLIDDRSQVEKAKAGVEAGKAEVVRAEAGVKVAQAGVAVAEAAMRRAQRRLDYTKIAAPFDGVVTRRLVDAGATVGPPVPGQTAPLLTVVRDDSLRVVFDVEERSAARATVGAAVVVHVPSVADGLLKGKITRTAGAFNPDTGTLRVEVDLPNPDGKLRPGLSVTVELTTGEAGK